MYSGLGGHDILLSCSLHHINISSCCCHGSIVPTELTFHRACHPMRCFNCCRPASRTGVPFPRAICVHRGRLPELSAFNFSFNSRPSYPPSRPHIRLSSYLSWDWNSWIGWKLEAFCLQQLESGAAQCNWSCYGYVVAPQLRSSSLTCWFGLAVAAPAVSAPLTNM